MPSISMCSSRAVSYVVGGAVGLTLLCSHAAAQNVPTVTLDWFASNDGVDPVLYNMGSESDQINPLGGGAYQFLGGTVGQNESWALDWDISAYGNGQGANAGGNDGNAFVTANLAVFNTSTEVQQFWALVTLSLDSAIAGGTLQNGTVSASVQNFFGDSANLSTITTGQFANDPIYDALIDGSSSQSLWDSPFNLTASPGNVAQADTAFGSPNPIIGPDANNSISVWLKFELNPGDSANVIGFFEVNAIPAPGALPLLAGFALLGGRRRRRA